MKTKNNSKPNRFEHWAEAITWIVMILVLIFLRVLPQNIVATQTTYYLIGAIISFALFYYLVVYRVFSRTQRLWIKDISDVVIISVLIIIAKDYGVYLFSLYFLPIAAATLVLGTVDSLLIAAFASIFVVFEIFLNAEDILPHTQQLVTGIWQIGSILLITLFCRFLALQIRQERKAREEALARTKALEEIEKREREFMTLTSHQLFTPLSIIRGFSSLLYRDEKKNLNKKQFEYSKEIYDNTRRLIDLVSELLSISRIRSEQANLKLSQTHLETLIKHVVEQLEPNTSAKKISLEFNKPLTTIPKLKIDPLRFEQVIYNVVDNAIKFTDKGKVVISLKKTVSEVVIIVKDTGRGISYQDMQKLFQPFYRGQNILELEKDGTGLGLYIAKTIAEKHGGKVWAESEIGEGSTFYISLPI